MRVFLKNGKELFESKAVRDVFSVDAISFKEVEDKIRECAEFSKVFNPSEVSRIIKAVKEFDSIHDVSEFVLNELVK
jgi:hypothetical protein